MCSVNVAAFLHNRLNSCVKKTVTRAFARFRGGGQWERRVVYKRVEDFSSCAWIKSDIEVTGWGWAVISYTRLKHSCSNRSCVDITAGGPAGGQLSRLPPNNSRNACALLLKGTHGDLGSAPVGKCERGLTYNRGRNFTASSICYRFCERNQRPGVLFRGLAYPVSRPRLRTQFHN